MTRILRDIEKQDYTPISLREKSVAPKTAFFTNALDCSGAEASNSVLTNTDNEVIRDISPRNIIEEEKEKVFFINEDESARKITGARVSDVLRLATAGLIILVVINLINIYYRGTSIKNDVIASANSGYYDLLQAGTNAGDANFYGAEVNFYEAQQNFKYALNEIEFLRANSNYFLAKEQTVESIQSLLDAAIEISSAGNNFSRGIKNLSTLPAQFVSANSDFVGTLEDNSGTDIEKESLTDKLKEDLNYVTRGAEQINRAKEHLDNVNPAVLTPTFREKLVTAKEKVRQISEVLEKAQKHIPAFLNLLGDRYPHRYLILLQNDTESRPTGGFIGSYIIMDINDGNITKMDFKDVYELDGQLQEYIEPPPDIARVSTNWRMRDSNYSPDFSISAEKAAWFLQKQKGPSVDTVIAINQSYISELLKLTGPIQLSGLHSSLNSGNFQIILSYIIESKLSGASDPKQILRELIPAFKEQILTKASLEDVFQSLAKAVTNKKIMFYSRDEKIQNTFSDFGMTGEVIKQEPGYDYLNVIATSIGGNKSDRYIEQKIRHYTFINKDGTLKNEIIVSRKHTWTQKDFEEWRNILRPFGFTSLPDHIADILGRGNNKTFIKIYVPRDSEIIFSEGVDTKDIDVLYDEETDKTYFMYETEVRPGTEKSVAISYILPFSMKFYPADSYKIFIQSQPGVNPSTLDKKVYYSPGLTSYRQFPDIFKKSENEYLFYAGFLNKDMYMSALLGT